MHFSLISIVILISCSATYSHPTSTDAERNEPNLTRARPIQQFFKNIFAALRSPTTTEQPTKSTTKRISVASSYQANYELVEIPNYVDFSTYLLESFASNNSAIKFTYMQPNVSAVPMMRSNFSVISFIVPNGSQNKDSALKGIFDFFNSLRLPWNREPSKPSNTDYSYFPQPLESWVERLQNYYSVFKYADDSRMNNTIVVFVPDGASINPMNIHDEEIGITTDYPTETTTLQDEETTVESNIASEIE